MKRIILAILLVSQLAAPSVAAIVDDPLCDLAVTKAGPQQGTPDVDLTYTISVTNNGPDPAANARVTDQLDPSLSFVSITPPTGWTCMSPPIGTTGNIVCTNPNYAPGTVDNFTLVAHSSPTTPTNNFITNKASVSTDTFDVNDENNDASATTLISTAGGMTNVGIQKFADKESALAGTAITFSILLNNSDLAQNVQLKDPLPAGMTFVSVSAPNGWNCQAPAPNTNGTVTCAIGSLSAVKDQQFSVIAKIPLDASSGTTFTNIASVMTDSFDTNDEDNSAAAAVTVAPGYTISVLSGSPQSTTINSAFPSTLQALVKDEAGNPASGVTVDFQTPANGPSATFASTTSTTESVTTDANGIATSSILTANNVAGGPYNISATASSATINFSVTNLKGSQTINFPAIPPKTYGDPAMTLQATATSGLPVTFSLISGPASLNGATLSFFAAGNIVIRARQSGDANYNAATPVDQTITIARALPTVTVSSSRNPSDFGESLTFTAIVAGPANAAAPSGSVQFADGNTNILSPSNCIASNNNCIAQVTISTLTSGSHTISAKYSADLNYLQNIGTTTQTVKPPPSISVSDVSDSEGNSGTKKFDFLVILSATSNLPVKVDYATADGTATVSNNDYQATSGSVTFNPGEKIKTITVLVNGDINREGDETFFLNIKNPINATISRSQGIALILNDDTLDPPQLILEENATNPNQAAAVDSLLLLRDPFPVKSAATWLNLGPDSNTRLLIFASTLHLAQTDTSSSVIISITDANGSHYDVPAEDVRLAPNQTDLTQITFRLPDNLPPGPCALVIKFHGLFSNQGIVHIK